MVAEVDRGGEVQETLPGERIRRPYFKNCTPFATPPAVTNKTKAPRYKEARRSFSEKKKQCNDGMN